MRTVGLSPKAVLAFLFPFLTAIGAVVISWITTGEWNEQETRVAVAGLVASGLALVGAYVGNPGNVVSEPDGDQPVVPPGMNH